jgi:hypothetical protein
MKTHNGSPILLALALALLYGCTTHVRVEQNIPPMVAEPRDLSVVLVMDQAFQTYVARPIEDTSIEIGSAQTEAMIRSFNGLFSQVQVVQSKDRVRQGVDLVIVPSVREVQLSTPSESYLNVYEVWIKYNLEIETGDGVPIDNWFLPAYGKTPSSYLVLRSNAIEDAAYVALRDAGAKLMLDFFRIPAIYGWMQQRESAGAQP